jgi:hypothetical protein
VRQSFFDGFVFITIILTGITTTTLTTMISTATIRSSIAAGPCACVSG